MNTVCTVELASPPGIKSDLSCNIRPVLFPVIRITVSADDIVVQNVCVEIKGMPISGIREPTHQFIVVPFTADVTYLFTIVNINRLSLTLRSVLNRIIRAVVRYENQIVGFQDPFCINCHTALWHVGECVW